MLQLGKSEDDFLALYSEYGKNIKRLLIGMTGNEAIADELMQEAFTKAWVKLPSFAFKSSLKTWVYQVAINVGRDWLRGHKNRNLDFEENSLQETDIDKKSVQEALSSLPDEMREILILFYWEGMDHREMARVLEVPKGTVKSRLFTARTKLKEALLIKGYEL